MAAQRQTTVARKLEVLRFEKRLLLAAKTAPRAARRPSLKAVVTAAAALRKLQKPAANASLSWASA